MNFYECQNIHYLENFGERYLARKFKDPFYSNDPLVYDIDDAHRGWFNIGPGGIHMFFCSPSQEDWSFFKPLTEQMKIQPKFAAFIKSEANKIGPLHIDIESRVGALNFPVYGDFENSFVRFFDSGDPETAVQSGEDWYLNPSCGTLFRGTKFHQVFNLTPKPRVILSFHWDSSYSFETLASSL